MSRRGIWSRSVGLYTLVSGSNGIVRSSRRGFRSFLFLDSARGDTAFRFWTRSTGTSGIHPRKIPVASVVPLRIRFWDFQDGIVFPAFPRQSGTFVVRKPLPFVRSNFCPCPCHKMPCPFGVRSLTVLRAPESTLTLKLVNRRVQIQ